MTEDRKPGRAIVTGGSAGIGRATVLALARNGWDIGFTYNAGQGAADTLVREAEDAGGFACDAQADFTDPYSAARVVQSLTERLGGVDVLVNNAAINPRTVLAEETGEGLRLALAVNVAAPTLATQVAVSRMCQQGTGGRIVNVTSVLASQVVVGGGPYCASKAALTALTQVWALEYARHGITVNAVAPGYIATRMNPDAGEPGALERFDPSSSPVPIGRAADPAEVAAVVLWLVSGEAAYVTGQSIGVDGGLPLVSGPEELRRAAARRS